MTREEFMSQKADSERRICRRVIPLGVIYSIRITSAPAAIILAVLLVQFFATEARTTILLELGFCLLLFGASFPGERDSTRQFLRLALRCPSCGACLVFQRAPKTTDTGCCYECGKRLFDL